MIARTRMTLRSWYGTSLRIPTYDSFFFPEFVASSIGIVRSVVQTRLSKEIQVMFGNTSTAHADQELGQIVINRQFLSGMFPGFLMPVDSDHAISALLGIIVHEAAHFAYSPKMCLEMYRDAVKAGTPHKFYPRLAATLGNVIEDIYIEAEIGRSVSSLAWMLDETNEIFFSEEKFEMAQTKALAVTDAPDDRQGVIDCINLLIYAKTRGVAVASPFVANLFASIRTATEKGIFTERTALCLEIYNALLCNMDDEDAPEEDGESQPGKGGEGMSEDQFEGELEKAESASEGVTAPHDGSEGDKKTKSGGRDVSSQVNRSLQDSKNDQISVEQDGESGEEGHRFYIEKTLELGKVMEMDARYARLAELGRQRASVNRPYGLDMNRGNTIRKLHRIVTDGKIFAQPVVMNNYKPMQVVILVDCSGSMMNGLRIGDEVTTRIEAALKAAIGAAHGLTEARCEVAVYGHTADMDGLGSVRIYRGKNFNEPVELLSRRFSKMFRDRGFSQNRDGSAINYVGRKFTAVGKRKLLIVISDGEPAAASYYGTSANRHCQKMVEGVRSRGVEVLSISITRQAESANNFIYGEKWNVFSEDPGVIEKIAKSLLG